MAQTSIHFQPVKLKQFDIMAASKGIPMQALLEEWTKENLEKAGF